MQRLQPPGSAPGTLTTFTVCFTNTASIILVSWLAFHGTKTLIYIFANLISNLLQISTLLKFDRLCTLPKMKFALIFAPGCKRAMTVKTHVQRRRQIYCKGQLCFKFATASKLGEKTTFARDFAAAANLITFFVYAVIANL